MASIFFLVPSSFFHTWLLATRCTVLWEAVGTEARSAAKKVDCDVLTLKCELQRQQHGGTGTFSHTQRLHSVFLF